MKKPTVVSDLLGQREGALKRLREGSAAAERALEALKRVLPPELADAVWSAVLREGVLSVFVRSAAWGTRLRYALPTVLPELADSLGEPVRDYRVKVRAGR